MQTGRKGSRKENVSSFLAYKQVNSLPAMSRIWDKDVKMTAPFLIKIPKQVQWFEVKWG